jgi:CDP-glycerol glycerophosphotransferase (TagB/SpsB family)
MGVEVKLSKIENKIKKGFLKNSSKSLITATLYNGFLNKPIKEKVILYEAFAGLGILDNPRAIFKKFLMMDEFKGYKHVWSIDDLNMAKDNIDEYSKQHNVTFVKRNSKKYIEYLATAKYLFNNSVFPYYFLKREQQVYINTWHGVPTKFMGYEHEIHRVENSRGPAGNFLMSSYMIAANQFVADVMYKRAYKVDGIGNGSIIVEGHPRSDAVINTNKEYIKDKIRALNINVNKKMILYAPTWKGSLYNDLNYNIDEFKNIIQTIKENINNDEYEVYLRVHYFVYKALKEDEELEKVLIPFTIDTNELLSVVDVLITDYSSIFFDFLSTGKPILFYVPDLSDYSENRGLYIPLSDLPGPISENLEEIANYLGDIDLIKERYKEKYQEMQAWCIPKDDGHVCERIIDIVFRENKEGYCIERNLIDKNKTKVLFFADWTKSMNWQEDLTKLFDVIDYNKYDITLLSPKIRNVRMLNYLQSINKNVRILIRVGMTNYSKKDYKFFEKIKNPNFLFDKFDTIYNEFPKKTLSDEWTRNIGCSSFDTAVFVGNITPFWSLMFETLKCKNKTIFLSDSALLNQKNINCIRGVNRFDNIILSNAYLFYEYMTIRDIDQDKLMMFENIVRYENFNRLVKDEIQIALNNKEYYKTIYEKTNNHVKTIGFVDTPKEGSNIIVAYLGDYQVDSLSAIVEAFYKYIENNNTSVYLFVKKGSIVPRELSYTLNKRENQQLFVINGSEFAEKFIGIADSCVSFYDIPEDSYEYLAKFVGVNYKKVKLNELMDQHGSYDAESIYHQLLTVKFKKSVEDISYKEKYIDLINRKIEEWLK